MTVLYADTSVLVRAYFVDEPAHESLRRLLLEGTDPVVTSELARVELASAVAAAARAGRLADTRVMLDRFDADCSDEGPLTLLRLDPENALPLAHRLVGERRLSTLDAIHLAVALNDALPLAAGDPLLFVTCERQQADAAAASGLAVSSVPGGSD